MHLAIYNYGVWGNKLYEVLEIFVLFSLVLCFFGYSLLNFYVFFEIVLVPVVLIIMLWGGNFERVVAGMYILIYTLLGSLPLLVMLMLLFNSVSLDYFILGWSGFDLKFVGGLMLVMAFFVRLPVFGLHL